MINKGSVQRTENNIMDPLKNLLFPILNFICGDILFGCESFDDPLTNHVNKNGNQE